LGFYHGTNVGANSPNVEAARDILFKGIFLGFTLSLHLGSPNHELSFCAFLVPTNWCSYKMVPCKFSLNLPLFGLGLSSKGRGSNLWLSTNKIVLFHWTMDVGPSFKVI
jgi:hypothetical protein